VPLSEHEQRVLRQIERQLQQERGFGRSLRVPADAKEAARNAKRGVLGFVVGLVALLASFASSWVVGLIGFLIMLGAATVLVQSVRRLAQEHWGQGAGGSAAPPDDHPKRPSGERKWRPGWTAGQHDDEPS